MNISVGICTRDNQKLLKKCLIALFKQSIPKYLTVNIIIVDQSFDVNLTKQITNSAAKKFLRKRNFLIDHIVNEKRGISFARNELFRISTGQILFITDDDVIVDKNWIRSGVNFLKKHEGAGVVGGKVELLNEIPRFFIQDLKKLGFAPNFWPYALFNLGSKEKKLRPNNIDYPVFANMAIKKIVYKNTPLDTHFGNQMSFFKVFGGEDPDFIEGARKKTGIYYNPKMRVYHFIKPSKFTKNFFYRRYWEFGKERALLEFKHRKTSSVGMKRLSNLLKEALKGANDINTNSQILFCISYFLTLFYLVLVNPYKNKLSGFLEPFRL